MPVSSSFYFWGEKARNVPSKAAVFELYDVDYRLIFVGECSNLKEKFAEYLETHFSKEPCKVATKYYKREFTPNTKERKKEILEGYKKKYGKLPKCNIVGREYLMAAEKEVGVEKGFHFYEELGKPLNQVAVSLKEFLEKVTEIPVASIEFHQNRGDFARWIRDTLGAVSLADAVETVKESGEGLRRQLIDLASQPEAAVLVCCPQCRTETRPMKIWSMAGRPSRMGERLRLTIGYYRCSECGKSFRKVIAKEKVKR
ncbi:MAG: hypothetical protein JSV15_01025 [Candidatus Bathyarchaeota archaeon]|nr:MAG: hypothetical protein JSV15_01025 [Candidatus Bathyarchaeota archaeon]